MKKSLFSLAVLAVSISMMACGNKSANNAGGEAVDSTEAVAAPEAETPKAEAPEAEQDPNLADFERISYKLDPEVFKFKSKPAAHRVQVGTLEHSITINIVEEVNGNFMGHVKAGMTNRTRDKDVTALGNTIWTYFDETEKPAGLDLIALSLFNPNDNPERNTGYFRISIFGNPKFVDKDYLYDILDKILANITIK